jgi:hypothetical protein
LNFKSHYKLKINNFIVKLVQIEKANGTICIWNNHNIIWLLPSEIVNVILAI